MWKAVLNVGLLSSMMMAVAGTQNFDNTISMQGEHLVGSGGFFFDIPDVESDSTDSIHPLEMGPNMDRRTFLKKERGQRDITKTAPDNIDEVKKNRPETKAETPSKDNHEMGSRQCYDCGPGYDSVENLFSARMDKKLKQITEKPIGEKMKAFFVSKFRKPQRNGVA